MTEATQDILVHSEAGVTTITFNRVDKKNSITRDMYAAMADALDAAIGAALPADGILCSDAEAAMANVAARHGVRHEPVNLTKGERVRDKTWHIQNANAHHSRLKTWVRSFNGVATRYLPNYLAWHHALERNSTPADPRTWIDIALNSQRE